MPHSKTHIAVPSNSSFSIRRTEMTSNTYKIHSHNNYELNYIVSGWGTRFVGDNIHSFSKGDLVLIGPGLPHCWEIKGVAIGKTPECITIHFQENIDGQQFFHSPELSPILKILKESKLGIQFYGKETSLVKNILLKMFEENRLRKLIYLLEIFEILVRTKGRSYLVLPGFSIKIESPEKLKLQKVYEYILANFSQKMELEKIAETSHMTTSAFCRFFKKYTGKTLFNYIKEVRIGYACKLLQDSDLNISEIAFQSGYNNIAHFNNQFKEICEKTPGNYRNEFRNFR